MKYGNRLKRHLNQTVEWKKRIGIDDYSKPKFDDARIIAARKEAKVRLVRDSMGNEVVSGTTVFCQSPVAALDEIDGATVITVSNMVDGAGKEIGREVYL